MLATVINRAALTGSVAGFGHAQACALVAKLPSYIFTRPTQAASAPGDTKEQNLGVALMRCERYGARPTYRMAAIPAHQTDRSR